MYMYMHQTPDLTQGEAWQALSPSAREAFKVKAAHARAEYARKLCIRTVCDHV